MLEGVGDVTGSRHRSSEINRPVQYVQVSCAGVFRKMLRKIIGQGKG